MNARTMSPIFIKAILKARLNNLTEANFRKVLGETIEDYFHGYKNPTNMNQQIFNFFIKISLSEGDRLHNILKRIGPVVKKDPSVILIHPRDRLKTLLTGPGGTDLPSMKYIILANLLNKTPNGKKIVDTISTDKQANELIKFALEVLDNNLNNDDSEEETSDKEVGKVSFAL
jgi:hypothetical protein